MLHLKRIHWAEFLGSTSRKISLCPHHSPPWPFLKEQGVKCICISVRCIFKSLLMLHMLAWTHHPVCKWHCKIGSFPLPCFPHSVIPPISKVPYPSWEPLSQQQAAEPGSANKEKVPSESLSGLIFIFRPLLLQHILINYFPHLLAKLCSVTSKPPRWLPSLSLWHPFQHVRISVTHQGSWNFKHITSLTRASTDKRQL